MWNSISVMPTIIASTWTWSMLSVEREVVLALNDAEPEAVPLQRIRRAHEEFARLLQGQLAVPGRDELDVCGVLHRAPDDRPVAGVLEPTAVRVVPPQVCVDDVAHRADVAPTGCVAADDHQPRVVESTGLLVVVATDVLSPACS